MNSQPSDYETDALPTELKLGQEGLKRGGKEKLRKIEKRGDKKRKKNTAKTLKTNTSVDRAQLRQACNAFVRRHAYRTVYLIMVIIINNS